MDNTAFFRSLKIGDLLVIGAINEEAHLRNLRSGNATRIGHFSAGDHETAAWHAFVRGLNVVLGLLPEPKRLHFKSHSNAKGESLVPRNASWLKTTNEDFLRRSFRLQIYNDDFLLEPEGAIHELYEVLPGLVPVSDP